MNHDLTLWHPKGKCLAFPFYIIAITVMQRHIINFNLQAEEERITREKQLEHEDRMAEELARISHESDRDKKMRQYIKENRYEPSDLFTSVQSIVFVGTIVFSAPLLFLLKLHLNHFQLRAPRVGGKAKVCVRE